MRRYGKIGYPSYVTRLYYLRSGGCRGSAGGDGDGYRINERIYEGINSQANFDL